jgi:hypothetical protein
MEIFKIVLAVLLVLSVTLLLTPVAFARDGHGGHGGGHAWGGHGGHFGGHFRGFRAAPYTGYLYARPFGWWGPHYRYYWWGWYAAPYPGLCWYPGYYETDPATGEQYWVSGFWGSCY